MTTTDFLKAINQEIAQVQYGQSPVELYQPIEYLMDLGGKRMRPLLTVMAASMFTEHWQTAVRPAIGVEVFHNFTLMHDDIMDKAPLRRGKPTVHAKWNDNIAILSGDVMLVCAYELMLDVEDSKLKNVLRRFNRTAAEVCEGQQFDMNFESLEDVSTQDYIQMIKLKTAVLLGFALELGGIIGGADQTTCQHLNEIGNCIGLGFQIKDDILDVYADPDKFGKQVGGDIIANKKTFMLIEAKKQANGSQKEALEKWLSAKEFDAVQKVKAVTEIYNDLNIRQQAETLMSDYFDRAFACIELLNAPASSKAVLRDFATWLISRES
jgi:geranylgeranyl diphosphate synthase type II